VLPGGALTSADHLWEIRQYADKVMFYLDGALLATHTRHLPTHYTRMYAGAYIANAVAGTAGVTVLAINDVRIENLDRLDVVVSQPRPEKLRGQMQDITANCPSASVSVGVTTNAATIIAATLDVGKRYRVTVVGGEGVAIRCDGVAAVVTNEIWWASQRFEIIATVATNPITAIKAVAGTADARIVVSSLDGGAVT
jgi:hypothetical protein